MKSKLQLFIAVVLLGTLCRPGFAQNVDGGTSVDQMTNYLEALSSNQDAIGIRARALASTRSRFAKIGDTLMQVARQDVVKQSAWQGVVPLAGAVSPLAPLAMPQTSAIGQPALSMGAPLMQAGGHQFTLSPSAQQSARRVLSVLPPYAQRFWLNAVRALRPEQTEAYFAYQNRKPLGYLQSEARMVASLLQTVPPQYQQTFMNGVVGVSPDEEQFAAQVMSLQIRQNANASAVFAQGQADLHQNGEIWGCILGGDCTVVRPIR